MTGITIRSLWRKILKSRFSLSVILLGIVSLVTVSLVANTAPAHAYGADGIVKVTVTIAPPDNASSIIVKVKRVSSVTVADNEITLTRTSSDTFTGDLNNGHLSCSGGNSKEVQFSATAYNSSGGGVTGQVLDVLGTSQLQNICNDPSSANFSVSIKPVTTNPGASTGTVCGTLSYYNPDTKQVVPYVTDNSNIMAIASGTSSGPAVKTDNNGKYCIGNLAPGTYKLVATYTSPQGKSLDTWTSSDFQITAGQTTTIDHAASAGGTTGTTTSGSEKETCNVTGIGWIICPLAVFIGKTVDAVYTLIEQFMVYDVPDPFGNNPLKVIWSNILGLANIAFVIAFFFVIFSQATSIGISNYGIKKMLPRMIAAAILVNLSYYICIFGIDISNAIGAGIDGILMSALPAAKTSGVHWETVIVGALGLGAAIAFAPAIVAAAISFAVPALLAVFVTLVVLVARYALITILIVISPLAFVAFILPNTEDLFNKWRKMFITLLVFYPMVAILFIGSKVAASIILLQ